MQKEYAFFPGCVLSQAAKESKISLEAIAPILGWKLNEIKGWSCCGASQAQCVDPIATLVANARNIALAEEMKMPMLTTCSTCMLTLTKAKNTLDKGAKERINIFLAQGGMKYQGSTPITSLLWELYEDLDNLKSKVKKPLSNLKVALFYGCHSLRPEDAFGKKESSTNPKSFESVVEVLGAKIVPFEKRLDCCGFHASYPAEKSVKKMSSQIVNNASENQADCVVTPCPLCQMQLDIYQERFQDYTNSKARLPIIHLSQLVGLALGLSKEMVGLDYNIIDAIIFANQSLYYIPLKELKQNILEFYELLNTGGILFATMMSKKNYYFSHSQKEEKNGLSKVEINGRLNETSFIHFIDKAEDLENLFQPFETLFLGDYDPINFYNFEGSAHHYIYIGIKK